MTKEDSDLLSQGYKIGEHQCPNQVTTKIVGGDNSKDAMGKPTSRATREAVEGMWREGDFPPTHTHQDGTNVPRH